MPGLNEQLFRQLDRKFKSVKIAREGVPLTYRRGRLDRYGHRQIDVHEAGEYYQVCCPFCRDTRHRLWINHRWGTREGGERLDFLVCCYNEHCEQTVESFQFKLRAFVWGDSPVPDIKIKANQATGPKEVKGLDISGNFTLLSDLPPDHAARIYMAGRQYDPDEISRDWEVQWCQHSIVMPPNNRLFFPMYANDPSGEQILVGGQSRYLEARTGNDKAPKKVASKWWTYPGTPKSDILYNGWRASKQQDIVVICEGPLDVIRVGPECSVALYGSVASERQKKLLWDNWGFHDAVGILAIDPDAKDSKKTHDLLEWAKGWKYFYQLELPEGVIDVGRMTTSDVWDLIETTIKNA